MIQRSIRALQGIVSLYKVDTVHWSGIYDNGEKFISLEQNLKIGDKGALTKNNCKYRWSFDGISVKEKDCNEDDYFYLDPYTFCKLGHLHLLLEEFDEGNVDMSFIEMDV